MSVNEVDNVVETDIVSYDVVWDTLVSEVADNFRAGATNGSIYLRSVGADQKSALASILRINGAQVTKLYIEKSTIFSQGSHEAFVYALEFLTVLTEFSVSECDVFDKLASKIMQPLRNLAYLRKVAFIRIGLTKGISESLRQLCQASTSLESIIIREDNVTEQVFSWVVSSALHETRTSVSFYAHQNRQLRHLRQGRSSFSSSPSIALSSLALNARCFEEVPHQLFQSEHIENLLTRLDLSNNSLTSLTESIGKLENLSRLDVSCNQLSVLPVSLRKLIRLVHLNVAYNELLELTDALGFLQNLQSFNVKGNRLRSLPLCLGCLPQLEELEIQDPNFPTNRFDLAQELVDCGSLAILAFLKYDVRRTLPYGIAPVYFVGKRDSGKSRVIQLLSHGSDVKNYGWGRQKSTSQNSLDSARGFMGLGRKSSLGTSDTGSSTSSKSSDNNYSFLETSLFQFQSSRSETARKTSGGTIGRKASLGATGRKSSVGGIGRKTSLGGAARKSSVGTLDGRSMVAIEAWEFTGRAMIPLYQRKSSCFVVTCNVVSERFSALMLLKTIHAICMHKMTRIIIIGTFPEAALPPGQVARIEAELDRVSAALPKVIVARVLVSLRGDNNKSARKILRKVFTRLTSEMVLPSEEVPTTWIVFGKMLRVLGQTRTVPVITWDELRQHALQCQIPPESVRDACLFLEKTAHITFSEGVGEDWCILSPTWIAAMWSPMRSLQHTVGHRGIVRADELVLAWQAMSCPSWAAQPWISLLKRLQMVLPLPCQRLLIVPHLLAPSRPVDIDTHWPTYSSPDQIQYSRFYTLPDSIVDEVFFSQLLLCLLRGNWSFNCVWRSGMCLTSTEDNELLLVEGFSAAIKVHLRVNGGVSAQLVSVINTVNILIQEYVSGPFTVHVPCIHCLKDKSYDPYMFSRGELEDAVSNGKGVVLCRSVNPILIHSMAPDISMAGIAAHTIEYSELSNMSLVGEGGFAKVYRAVWRGQEVAVKKLLPVEGHSVSGSDGSEERRSLFSNFRREAWLMSGLEHPNLVILMGVCLEPFSIIMEFVNAGTLHSVLHNDAISGEMPRPLVLKIALDIAKGMEFLHGITPPIVHRDLKSPNILLHTLSRGPEGQSLQCFPDARDVVAKVSDFGLSIEASLEVSGSVVDNPTWTAPEMLSKKKYNTKVDVYSFGVILWEIATRKIFFGEIKFMSELENMVRSGKRPEIPAKCPLSYRLLVEACWSQDATKRPTFREVQKVLQTIAVELGIVAERLTENSGPPEPALRRSSTAGLVTQTISMTAAATEEAFCEAFDTGQTLLPRHESSIQSMIIVEPHLWSGSSHGEIFVWDLRTQVLKHQAQVPALKKETESGSRRAGVTAMHSLKHTVWTGHSEGSIAVWSRDLKLLKQPKRHLDSITYIGSEGSDTVITAGMGGSIRRWNIHNFKYSTVELGVPILCVVQMGVNHVIGSMNQVYLLFPDKTWFCAPQHHSAAVHSVVLVRDMVWTASSDKTICVWRLGVNGRSLEHIRTLNGHSSRVFSLAVDSLGSRVFSGSWDTAVMVWNVDTFGFAGRLHSQHTDAVSQLAYFVLDGAEFVLSGSMDASIVIYRHRGNELDSAAEAEDVAMQREIASYLARQRSTKSLAEESDEDDMLKDPLWVGPGASAGHDRSHLDLLTPAERQHVTSMQDSSSSSKSGFGSSSTRMRRGSLVGNEASASPWMIGGLLSPPRRGVRQSSAHSPPLPSDAENSGTHSTHESAESSGSVSPSVLTMSSRNSGIQSSNTSPRAGGSLGRRKSSLGSRPLTRIRSATVGSVGSSSGSSHESSGIHSPLSRTSSEGNTSVSRSPPTPTKGIALDKIRGSFRRNSAMLHSQSCDSLSPPKDSHVSCSMDASELRQKMLLHAFSSGTSDGSVSDEEEEESA